MRIVTFFSGFVMGLTLLTSVQTANAVLSQNDKNILSRIGSQISRGDFQYALAEKNKLSSRAAQNYVTWKYMTDANSRPSYLEIAKFVRQNPDMPKKHILREKLEQALMYQNDSIQMKYFLANDAVTGDGKIQEIKSLFQAGQSSNALQKLKDTWYHQPLTPQQTQKFIANFGKHLGRNDYSERIKYLLDNHYINDASRLLNYATFDDRKKLEVRAKLIRLNHDGHRMYQNLPTSLKQDAGVLRSLVHYYRKTNQDTKAIAVMSQLSQAQSQDNPVAWANHRIVLSRVAFKHGYKENAYRIVADNYLSEGADFVDTEFYAGWLALRYLNQPKIAYAHFAKGLAKSSMPLSISRFEYWKGRSCQRLNDSGCSRESFQKASQYFYTFYGQLAGYELGQNNLTITHPPASNHVVNQAYLNDGVIQAAYAADAMGSSADAYIMLLSVALRPNKHPAVHGLLEKTALELVDTPSRVRLAKTTSAHHACLMNTGYPVNQFNQQPSGLEKELVYALTRQESEFDYAAQSPVGARGLMQLMPATANLVARKMGVGYNVRMLTQNPHYNMRLGSKYLHDMVWNFNGSYIHALSAYNAGPGRIPQWNEDYGRFTPDTHQIIDRIEMIPFPETRNYVQRILEALQIYRAKISGSNTINVNNLIKDLKRGT